MFPKIKAVVMEPTMTTRKPNMVVKVSTGRISPPKRRMIE